LHFEYFNVFFGPGLKVLVIEKQKMLIESECELLEGNNNVNTERKIYLGTTGDIGYICKQI